MEKPIEKDIQLREGEEVEHSGKETTSRQKSKLRKIVGKTARSMMLMSSLAAGAGDQPPHGTIRPDGITIEYYQEKMAMLQDEAGVEQVLKSDPIFILKNAHLLLRRTYGWEVVKKAALINPGHALENFGQIADHPGAREFLKEVLEAGMQQKYTEAYIIDYAEIFLHEPWGPDVLDRVTKGNYGETLSRINKFKSFPNATDIIRRAIHESLNPHVPSGGIRDDYYTSAASTDAIRYFLEYQNLLPEAEQLLQEAAEKCSIAEVTNLERYFEVFINRPWAQGVVTEYVKKSPRVAFQSLADANALVSVPWGQELLIQAGVSVPDLAIRYFHAYQKIPGAHELLNSSVKQLEERSPAALLRALVGTDTESAEWKAAIDNYEPILKGVVEKLVQEKPAEVLLSSNIFIHESWAKPLIEQAARRNPQAALLYFWSYKNIDGGGEDLFLDIAEKAVEDIPQYVLQSLQNVRNKKRYYKILERAAENHPVSAAAWSENSLPESNKKLKDVLSTMHTPSMDGFKKILEAVPPHEPSTGGHTVYRSRGYYSAMLLLQSVVYEGMSVEQAYDLTRGGEGELFHKLLEITRKPHYLGRNSIGEELHRIALEAVFEVNRLHESPDEVRFHSVESYSPTEMYSLMVHGQEKMFTSTFNGMFDRMLGKMAQGGISGDQVISEGGEDNFRTFIRLLAEYNRLEEFLGTMAPEARLNLINKFIRSIEQERDSSGQAVAVADTLSVIRDVSLLKSFQQTLKSEYERNQTSHNEKGKVVYGLLSSMFRKSALLEQEWFQGLPQEYALPNLKKLDAHQLFDAKGRDIQQYFFYDDEDGRVSFKNFLLQYRSGPWIVEEHEEYVRIASRHRDNGLTVEIYANKPNQPAKGQEAIKKALDQRGARVSVAVHRGHSYHAADTIKVLPSEAALVYLGSCGGYRIIDLVLDKIPHAQMITTKGKGTAWVNDPFLKLLNEEILIGADIDWAHLWQKGEKKLSREQGDFQNYVRPDRNLGVMFLQAYRGLLVEEAQKAQEEPNEVM